MNCVQIFKCHLRMRSICGFPLLTSTKQCWQIQTTYSTMTVIKQSLENNKPVNLINIKCNYSLKYRPTQKSGTSPPPKEGKWQYSFLTRLGFPLMFLGGFIYVIVCKPSWFHKQEDVVHINSNNDNSVYVNKVREELYARKLRKQSPSEMSSITSETP